MNGNIEITEAQITVWAQEGIKKEIADTLRRGYGMGDKLKKTIEDTVAQSEPQIKAAIQAAIAQACISPEFIKGIEVEVSRSLASSYRGCFDGVIKAAAKTAANTEVVAKRVVELTQAAALAGKP